MPEGLDEELETLRLARQAALATWWFNVIVWLVALVLTVTWSAWFFVAIVIFSFSIGNSGNMLEDLDEKIIDRERVLAWEGDQKGE